MFFFNLLFVTQFLVTVSRNQIIKSFWITFNYFLSIFNRHFLVNFLTIQKFELIFKFFLKLNSHFFEFKVSFPYIFLIHINRLLISKIIRLCLLLEQRCIFYLINRLIFASITCFVNNRNILYFFHFFLNFIFFR